MRAKILLCSLISTLILGFSAFHPAAGSTPDGYDTLTFIHLTDIHVCNLTGYHPAFVQKRQHFGNGIVTFPGFLRAVPVEQNADMVIITGDNIDFYEAETEKGWMLDTQIEQYARILDNSKVPVYLTLGNHDIASYRITPGPWTGSNQIEAEKARAAWIKNVPCFKDGTYYSRIYKIDTVTYRFIFLDNAYYSTEEISDGELSFTIDPFQLRWLDAQLKASPSDVEIVFMHIPLPNSKPADNKILTEATSAFSSITDMFNLFSVLENSSSTTLIFGGHNHVNFINRYNLPDGDILTQVRTGSLGYDQANWRVIKVTKDKILISLPGSTKTEYTVQIN